MRMHIAPVAALRMQIYRKKQMTMNVFDSHLFLYTNEVTTQRQYYTLH